MQTKESLADRDKSRLRTYEEFAKSHSSSEVVVPRQRTFRLVRNRISVREILDEITKLDDEYEWKNYGTNTKPVIVIQPRVESVLNWTISPICKTRPVATEKLLAGCKAQQCGPFIQALSERNMSVMYIAVDEPAVPGKPTADQQPPHGFVDLCSNYLRARDVLNRIAQSTHTSWTLGGIKGTRLISFGGHY